MRVSSRHFTQGAAPSTVCAAGAASVGFPSVGPTRKRYVRLQPRHKRIKGVLAASSIITERSRFLRNASAPGLIKEVALLELKARNHRSSVHGLVIVDQMRIGRSR